jgi:hypothetical protein
MIFRRAQIAGTFALLIASIASAAAAIADQTYAVDGSDTFRAGGGEVRSQTIYHGVQRLSVARSGATTIYTARVEYDKTGDGGRQHQSASFTSTVLPSGSQKDGPSSDPDYLTVLNQPFAVQLDAPTLRDLGHLKRPVPFSFPSPMTGALLRGTLRRLPDAIVGGSRAMGIAFEATGPLHGALPDRPAMALAGSITMKGTAYYDPAGRARRHARDRRHASRRRPPLAGLDRLLALDPLGRNRRSRPHHPRAPPYVRPAPLSEPFKFLIRSSP